MLRPAPGDTLIDTKEITDMASPQRIWMTRQDYTQLHTELAALRSRRIIEVPDDCMDYDPTVVADYPARRTRIREIQDLLTSAVVSADAAADRIAEPGMVLTIRYDATGETETFLLGRRFGEGADVTVYSTLSPLGHAIAGARPGEQRIYSIPNETRPVLVTLLEALPYRRHVAEEPPTHSVQGERPCSSGIQLREKVGSRSCHRRLRNPSHAAQ